jgi:PAS domain S-box-containing protein
MGTPPHSVMATLPELGAVVNLAPEGIFVADCDGRYTFVNEAGCRLLGYRPEEIVGRTILDLIPVEDRARLLASKAQMLEGASHVAEWQLRRKDGRYVPVEVSANILPDGQWLGFVHDISERRAHEAERAALFAAVDADRHRLQALLDTLPLGVLFFQPDARLYFNRRAEELLGSRL